MRRYIPLIISHVPVILLRVPTKVHTITMNLKIEANISLGFVYSNTHLSVKCSALIKASCSGYLCDGKFVID